MKISFSDVEKTSLPVQRNTTYPIKLIPFKTPTTMNAKLPRRFLTILALSTSSLIGTSTLHAAVTPTTVSGPKLPPIWVKAGPQERLKALRAAELDGDRLLAERVYGLMVDADTSVQDLALQSDAVKGAVEATLVGAITQGEPEYKEDGQVQVVRAVKIQEITRTLSRVIQSKKLEDGSIVTTSDKSNVNQDVKDKVLDVMGNAALPGSEGQQKIMAKRAAEMDAYRRLAGRMMGVKISGNTTVKDMALENDKILASLSQTLKSATPTAIQYNESDGSCAVTMEVKVADVVRTINHYSKNGGGKTEIKDEIETKTFSETGNGAMRPAADPKAPKIAGSITSDSPSSGGGSEPFYVTTAVLKEVVQTGTIAQ